MKNRPAQTGASKTSRPLQAVDESTRERDWKPWVVFDIDLAQPVGAQIEEECPRGEFGGAWILLRVFEEPVGSIQVDFSNGDLREATFAALIPPSVASIIGDRLQRADAQPSEGGGRVPISGSRAAKTPQYLERRGTVIRSGPEITVVVCTRDQPEGLARCLASLQEQSYPRASVLVVDNASTSGAPRLVAQATEGPLPIRYVFEAAPGLSRARNRSLLEVGSPLVAWIDDDEVADHHWLSEIVGGFVRHPGATAVCGVMIPAELATQAQYWFEEYGGHSKGRGFVPAIFSPETRATQNPLFPLPPFGTGGNMAMRTSSIKELGFDEALGAGTRAMGGEDTRALTELLLQGTTILYQPTAITRHFHRRDYEALRRQFYGYGAGLSAFYTSLLLDRPAVLLELVSMFPSALRELRDPRGARLGGLSERFPVDLLREHRRGMVRGPLEYLKERLRR